MYKDAAKKVIQKLLLSGPIYGVLRKRASAVCGAYVGGARERLEGVSPRPSAMRASAAPVKTPVVDISVIVPVYNVEKYVGACLESILAQQVDGTFEVVVVNDGSTDRSADIVSRYVDEDSRVRLVTRENGGLSAARNTGIDEAVGRYIAFVDSDDMLAPGHLSALMGGMGSDCNDFVSGLYRRMTDGGEILGAEEEVRTCMAPWARLYKRDVWKVLRFPVGGWYEDLITPCCIQPLFSEGFVSDMGYLYRMRPGSIVETSSENPKALDSFWVLEELLAWREWLGVAYRPEDYERLLPLFGPLLLGRTLFLSPSERRALFSLCCDLFASIEEFKEAKTARGGAWTDLEAALRTRSYVLWCLACAALAAPTRSVKLADAWAIYREAAEAR